MMKYNKNGDQNMVADRIKTLRQEANITQSELAKNLNITRSSVNAWEMGISVPSTQFIVELAQFFKVSTDYLLGLSQQQSLDITSLTEEQRQIILTLMQYFGKENQKSGF